MAIIKKKFRSYAEAIGDTLPLIWKDYDLKTNFLPKGTFISSRSSGDWLLAEGEQLSLQVGSEKEDIAIDKEGTAAIFIPKGKHYHIEAKSNIHLKALIQRAA